MLECYSMKEVTYNQQVFGNDSVTELKGFMCLQTSKPRQMGRGVCSQGSKGY